MRFFGRRSRNHLACLYAGTSHARSEPGPRSAPEVARESIHEEGNRCAKRLPCSKLGAKLAPSGAPLSMLARAASTGVVAAPGWERSRFVGSLTGPPPEQLTTSPLGTNSGGRSSQSSSPIPALQGKSRGPPITPRMQERPAINLRICSHPHAVTEYYTASHGKANRLSPIRRAPGPTVSPACPGWLAA